MPATMPTVTPTDELTAAMSKMNVSNSHAEVRRSGPALSAISVDGQTGEVIVHKSSGKVKIRKGQSQEEYELQLRDYFEVNKGPKRTEIGWMDDADTLHLLKKEDMSIKLNRQALTNFCQRLYYQRQYEKCIYLSQELLQRYRGFNKKNKIQREIDELEYMVQRSQQKENSIKEYTDVRT